jgi:dienelactone hydrolase
VSKGALRLALVVGSAFIALSTQVLAQQPPAARDIPAPTAQPGELVLKTTTTSPATEAESWVQLGDARVAHNVSKPTLTPFLPPADKATGAAVIIAPGGGFLMLSMDSEGYRVARFLQSQGIAAFVLKYRLEASPPTAQGLFATLTQVIGRGVDMRANQTMNSGLALATEDAKEALRVVRAHAVEWKVDPKRVGFLGFSAGAFTTINLALTSDATTRPDFVAPIYGSMSAPTSPVPASPPPLWAALSSDDPLLGKTDFSLINEWRAKGGTVEFHLYEKGGHGWGYPGAAGTTTELWGQEFVAWMKSHGWLTAAK